MADAIAFQIADNIKTALAGVVTYPTTATATIEYERMWLKINNRYPFIQISGPWVQSDVKTTRSTHTNVQFIIKTYIKENDENETVGTELPYLTRNVASNIIKAIMVDPSRGQLAQKTEYKEYGYSYDLSYDDSPEFYIYVVLEVTTRINAFDPTLVG